MKTHWRRIVVGIVLFAVFLPIVLVGFVGGFIKQYYFAGEKLGEQLDDGIDNWLEKFDAEN